MKTLKPAWRNWIIELIAFPFLLLVSVELPYFLILAIPAIAVPLYHRISKSYQYNNKKIESSVGLIAQRIDTIRIKDLRNVNMQQGIIQRILRTGDLEFSSSGGGGIEVRFKGVSNPRKIKNLIEDMQEELSEKV